MSNKHVVMLLGVCLIASVASAIVPISLRMRGLSPALVGIVDDEYSDIFYNPAFVNRVEGNRIYTNLSNLQGYGEDMFFDKAYYPLLGSYNLFGGITEKNGMKLGALLELSGIDYLMSMSEYTKVINGSSTEIESTEASYRFKYTSTALNLLWGKKMSSFDLGVLAIPKWYADEYKSFYSDAIYDINSEITEYDYEYEESVTSEKSFAIPIVVGIVMGEPENEMAFSLGYGYEWESGIIPTDYLESELEKEISSWLAMRTDQTWKEEYLYDRGGFYLSANARNKKRFSDYSLSYLGEISYAHQPTNMSYLDSTYELTIYDTLSGAKLIESDIVKQKASGTMNRLALGVGFGIEKHFDIMNTNTMFAIGLLPSFFTGTSKMNVTPESYYSYYYRNYPDTLEYTVNSSTNEYLEITNKFSGFSITVPVGLETRLTDRLRLRLGATQHLMLKTLDSYNEVMIDSGQVSIYHRTKPTELTQTVQEPAGELDSYTWTSENKMNFTNATEYHYGLGYKVNDNVEINLLNFADLTKLHNWVLGVNIKF